MHLKVSKRRASAISSGMLLILLAVNTMTGIWYPYIFITIGAPIFARQFLTGRIYDSCVTLCIFGGLFLVERFYIEWKTILPVIFILSALLILFREFCSPQAEKEPEHLEDVDLENREDKD